MRLGGPPALTRVDEIDRSVGLAGAGLLRQTLISTEVGTCLLALLIFSKWVTNSANNDKRIKVVAATLPTHQRLQVSSVVLPLAWRSSYPGCPWKGAPSCGLFFVNTWKKKRQQKLQSTVHCHKDQKSVCLILLLSCDSAFQALNTVC